MRRYGCSKAGVAWIGGVRRIVDFHVIVDQLAYSLSILEDFTAAGVVIFGILNHAFEVTFDLRDCRVGIVSELAFNIVNGQWELDDLVVVRVV